jgi:hypothetical protein
MIERVGQIARTLGWTWSDDAHAQLNSDKSRWVVYDWINQGVSAEIEVSTGAM